MAFIGVLRYHRAPDLGVSFVGRPFYLLCAPFAYCNDLVKRNFIVECEVGYATDFASIPKYFFFLSPKDHDWRKAAVIHDKACDLARFGMMTMEEADNYLYYAMRDNGSSVFTSWLFWLWTRGYHKWSL